MKEQWRVDENRQALSALMDLLPTRTADGYVRFANDHRWLPAFVKNELGQLKPLDEGQFWAGEVVASARFFLYDDGLDMARFHVVECRVSDGRWGVVCLPKVDHANLYAVLDQIYSTLKDDGLVDGFIKLTGDVIKAQKKAPKSVSL